MNIRETLLASRIYIVVLTILLVVFTASRSVFWQELEQKGYDLLTVNSVTSSPDLPIVIVGIDEPSFEELNQQWPWSRDTHARLVNSLKNAGATVIAFDVVFAEPSDETADNAFAAAIQQAGNVVLAGDLVYQETAQYQQLMHIEPLAQFRQAGAISGIVSITLDGDQVVRRISDEANSFWQAVLQVYHRQFPPLPGETEGPGGNYVRYLGKDHSFQYVSYYQALNPDKFLPPDTFRNRIVLIGYDVKTSPEPGRTQADMYATPFTSTSELLMPGVELQATFLANAMQGSGLNKAPQLVVIVLTISVLFIAAAGMRRWQLINSLLLSIVLLLACIALTWWAFNTQQLWLPVLSPMLAVVLMYMTQGAITFAAERQRRLQIKNAFAHYVSPDVVDEMSAHPERLVLGGQRRDLTIMFTDIAEFTNLSEQLSPEQVSHLLNTHLSAMTDIIMKYGGTVDKFIGDAIMAFWNAPLDDEEHAMHACQAARDMMGAMQTLREQFVQEGLPVVHMRVGMHSGAAVVGNMGSDKRFDYTAIGDNVNLASRLEGINKLYGTEVILSSSTAGIVGNRIPLQVLDKVRVKGKTRAVEIFTFASDQPIPVSEAVEATRGRDWDRAEVLWQKIVQQPDFETLARLYLQRISEYRVNPPPTDWDGSVALEKM